MMLKGKKRIVSLACCILVAMFFLIVSYYFLPRTLIMVPVATLYLVEVVIFLFVQVIVDTAYKKANQYLERKTLYTGETSFLQKFIDSIRFCYSYDDFYKIIQDILEVTADCSVIYIDSKKNYVLYSSPDKLTSDPKTLAKLTQNFPSTWQDGVTYLGHHLGVVSKYKKARGFFLSSEGIHLFIFCRYTRLFDLGIYKPFFAEFERFQKRTATISGLSEVAGLSKEWEQLAETQRLFLPQEMPNLHRLKVAAYFRPLVNVSGDYYSILPIDKHKTLLMLGDVSGKGLPAALIMGLVMNTVKIIEDKEDLVSIIYAVDKAIKGMKLQDKYTVLFLSIVDTQKMTIRYVNASMSDPLIVTRAPDGYRIKPLSSNCGVVGILDLDNVHVDEQRLFRDDLILFASDGVSEVMDDEGVELGDTEKYTETIKESASKQPQEFVDDIVNLIFEHKGNNKLHDDITMMVTKVVN